MATVDITPSEIPLNLEPLIEKIRMLNAHLPNADTKYTRHMHQEILYDLQERMSASCSKIKLTRDNLCALESQFAQLNQQIRDREALLNQIDNEYQTIIEQIAAIVKSDEFVRLHIDDNYHASIIYSLNCTLPNLNRKDCHNSSMEIIAHLNHIIDKTPTPVSTVQSTSVPMVVPVPTHTITSEDVKTTPAVESSGTPVVAPGTTSTVESSGTPAVESSGTPAVESSSTPAVALGVMSPVVTSAESTHILTYDEAIMLPTAARPAAMQTYLVSTHSRSRFVALCSNVTALVHNSILYVGTTIVRDNLTHLLCHPPPKHMSHIKWRWYAATCVHADDQLLQLCAHICQNTHRDLFVCGVPHTGVQYNSTSLVIYERDHKLQADISGRIIGLSGILHKEYILSEMTKLQKYHTINSWLESEPKIPS